MTTEHQNTWKGIDECGLYTAEAPFALAALKDAPHDVVRELLGHSPRKVQLDLVSPRPGGTSYVSSNIEGRFHTDGHPFAPAHLQLLYCIKQGDQGGETLFVDSWMLLDRTRDRERDFYEQLFTEIRIMKMLPKPWVGPTFSDRRGNLVFVQPPFASDEIGMRIENWIYAQEPVRIRLVPGQFLIANNHRLAHSRSAFIGARALMRALIWLDAPLWAPDQHKLQAALFQKRLKEATSDCPDWTRKRLGVYDDKAAPDAVPYRPTDAEVEATLPEVRKRLQALLVQGGGEPAAAK